MNQIAKYPILIVNIIVFLLSIFVLYISTDIRAIPMISQEYMTIITPANYTFRIWIVIYSAALVINIYFFYKIIPIKIVVVQMTLSILNTLWVFFWTNNILIVSWVINLLMFISLIYIVFSYNLKHYPNKWIARYFYLYYAWISIALLLQTVVIIQYFGFYEAEIYFSVIGILLIVWSAFRFIYSSIIYSVVIIWALLGVYFQSNHRIDFGFQCFVLFIVSLFISLLIFKVCLKIKRVTD